jgi:hypothetical protein
MTSVKRPESQGSLEDALRSAEPPVRYDVERGYARHQRLLESGAALPEWAAELPARSGPSLLRKWGPWLGAGLVAGAIVTWNVERPPTPEIVPSETVAGVAPETESLATQASSTPRTARPSFTRTPEAALRPHTDSSAPQAAAPTPSVSPAPLQPIVTSLAVPELTPEPAGNANAPIATHLGSHARERTSTLQERAVASVSPPPSKMPGARSPGGQASANADGQGPMDREEVMQLAQAEQLLLSSPNAALALVRKGNIQFKRGYLKHERRYIEVMALFAGGHLDEAQARARFFLRDYPSSPYGEKIRNLVQEHEVR